MGVSLLLKLKCRDLTRLPTRNSKFSQNSHGKSSNIKRYIVFTSEFHHSQHSVSMEDAPQLHHMSIITSSVNTEASTSTVIIYIHRYHLINPNISPSACHRTRRSVFHRAGASATTAAVCTVSKQLMMRGFLPRTRRVSAEGILQPWTRLHCCHCSTH